MINYKFVIKSKLALDCVRDMIWNFFGVEGWFIAKPDNLGID